MKLRLKVKDKEITVTIIDSETTRDFISLLPLTLTMDDLFGREKFGHLPRAIYDGGKRVRTYAVGDLIYWSSGPDVRSSIAMTVDSGAWHHSHRQVKSGVETLNVPGSVEATIERVGSR